MFRYFVYPLTAVLLLLVGAAQAHSSALTEAQVRNFIASMPAIQALDDRYPDLDSDDDDDAIDLANPMTSGVAKIRGHEAYGALNGVVKRHGFTGAEQWAQVGDRVLRAFMALSLQGEAHGRQAELAEAMREIDNNPNLSAEQRAQLKEMMGSSMQLMQSMSKAPPADLEVVRPHLAELQRVMDSD